MGGRLKPPAKVFAMQFGQLWDFADGGAETSSGTGLTDCPMFLL